MDIYSWSKENQWSLDTLTLELSTLAEIGDQADRGIGSWFDWFNRLNRLVVLLLPSNIVKFEVRILPPLHF